jgi:hypothetical protein
MGFCNRREIVKSGGVATLFWFTGCISPLNEQTDKSKEVEIYISEIVANPTGDDQENLNQETVLIEMNANSNRDLSGFTLSYSSAQTFDFPDLVSDVPPKATLRVHSGKGDSRVREESNPDFTLFVGSTTPLLANEGMELTLRDSGGNTIDRLSYPELESGEVYARPE